MSALLTALRERGCDIDSAMVRFLNNEEFYAKLYKKFVADPAFEGLGEALDGKDADLAFRHAHTLKGLTANMGLTPLYDLVVKIVEPLRAGNCNEELKVIYKELMNQMTAYRILATRDGE